MNTFARKLGLLSVLLLFLGGCATTTLTELPKKSVMQKHLQKLRQSGYEETLITLSEKYDLPATFLYAVASRETNCENILGDGGNGIGLMQIDIRYHDLAKQYKDSGKWQTEPDALIEYGVRLLSENLSLARSKLVNYPYYVQLYAAASNYNCGRAIKLSSKNGLDSDQCTTGRNYAHDVMLRKEAFDEILAAESKVERQSRKTGKTGHGKNVRKTGQAQLLAR